MRKILAFGASNSSKSINAQLARYAVEQLAEKSPIERCWIDLNDFEMPIFSVDREARDGIPAPAHRFKALIREAEGVLISLAEHNGSYSVAFKNLLDWTSRIERSLWLDRPLCLMATSPGARGGQSVLQAATGRFPHMNSELVSSFSLPRFRENFDPARGITDPALAAQFEAALDAFRARLEAST